MAVLQLGEIEIDVTQKDIKNIHLSVYPPEGAVRLAAPEKMDMDTIRVYAISKLDWIKKQRRAFLAQKRESPREFLNQESHYFFGKRYLLKIHTGSPKNGVETDHKYIHTYLRGERDPETIKRLLEKFYREELRKVASALIPKWEKEMDVELNEFGIKKMKTKWGTCNSEARRIWLNLELARKPKSCAEYIIVHELIHLLERSHNARFVALMDKFMPKWEFHRDELNRLPFRHVEWKY